MNKTLYNCDFNINDWIYWDSSADKLLSHTNKIINESKKTYNEIANLSGKMICYENIVNRLQDETAKMNIFYSMVSFLQYVSTNDDIINASMKCDMLLNNYFIELWNRKDVYNIINIFYKKINNSDKFKKEYPEDYRYISRVIRDFKRYGMELNDYEKDKLKNISEKISDLEIIFSKNLNSVDTILLFTKNELEGLDNNILSSLSTTIVNKDQKIKKIDMTLSEQENIEIAKQLGLDNDNDNNNNNKILKYEVSLQYPIYNACLRTVKNESVRELLSFEFNRRCIEVNTPIILKLIELRNEKAKLLNYSDHLDYTTEILVSKNGNNVKNFLKDLIIKTDNSCRKDLQLLNKTKGSNVNSWDVQYFKEQIKNNKYNIVSDELKQYFELNNTINKILDIYQQLFSLKFVKNDDKITWHQDVDMYDVFDKNNNNYIGTFYMDLYPRNKKYNHAACFPLQPSCSLSNKEKIYPVSAIVVNFTKPTDNNPSLLLFDDVVTFFHEFGHVMHQLLGRSKFSVFSGSSTETDFVEAPSQLLEYWCWEKESIKFLSKHYKTGKQLDNNTIDNLINIKNLLKGYSIRKQIYMAEFDIIIHSDQKLIETLKDTDDNIVKSKIIYYILKKLHKNIIGLPLHKNTLFLTSFNHFVNYDAQYYSYLWSDIYAADMFYEKFKNNLFNENIGLEYRKSILEKGGTIDCNILIEQFLGRKPTIDNYLKSNNLSNYNNYKSNNIIDKPRIDDYILTSDENNNNKTDNDIGIDLLDDY